MTEREREAGERRHDIQHNELKSNNTQHCSIQPDDKKHNNTRRNYN